MKIFLLGPAKAGDYFLLEAGVNERISG